MSPAIQPTVEQLSRLLDNIRQIKQLTEKKLQLLDELALSLCLATYWPEFAEPQPNRPKRVSVDWKYAADINRGRTPHLVLEIGDEKRCFEFATLPLPLMEYGLKHRRMQHVDYRLEKFMMNCIKGARGAQADTTESVSDVVVSE